MTALPAWITDPALDDAWRRIRDRFERAGLVAAGYVQLTDQMREQRHALGALLGRSVTRPAVRIDLAALDRRLRERSGAGGLDEVLTALHGTPPTDRPAARAQQDEARRIPLDRAVELVRTPWAPVWADSLRRTGLLTGRGDAVKLVEDAAAVLGELVVPEVRQQSRVELAARLLGDAHALDADRLLHRLVLRGLAAAAGTAVPDSAPDAAQLWSRFGVEPDLLSRTCLVLGIAAPGPGGTRLRLAAEAGDPVHLTAWDLRRLSELTIVPGPRETGPSVTGPSVLVCENPRVLEALAESGDGAPPVVCTSGEPNLVVHAVLGRLRAAGVPLRYHGDFDWPGIGIANRMRASYGAQPWLMTADDYVRAVRRDGVALGSVPVEPSWDGELGAAMRRHGRAVHEEAVLAEILARCRSGDGEPAG